MDKYKKLVERLRNDSSECEIFSMVKWGTDFNLAADAIEELLKASEKPTGLLPVGTDLVDIVDLGEYFFSINSNMEEKVNDLISRQAAIDALCDNCDNVQAVCPHYPCKQYTAIDALPSAQPERQNCERWIPVKTRPMDEEEREYFLDYFDWHLDEDEAVMFESLMPGDGQEVWVCSKCGNVWQDICVVDKGIYLEGNGDWKDIVAWMPFARPEPYKGDV